MLVIITSSLKGSSPGKINIMSTTDLKKDQDNAQSDRVGNITFGLIIIGILGLAVTLAFLATNFVFTPRLIAKVQDKTDRAYVQLTNIADNPEISNKVDLITGVQTELELNPSSSYEYKISYEFQDDSYSFCVKGLDRQSGKIVAESGNCS